MQKVGDLEIPEDLDFQRRNWAAERVGWLVLGLIIVAAVLGLFGNGPLGAATAVAEGGRLSVEYERFWRLDSPMALRVHVGSQAAENGHVRVWLARSYVESVSVENVVPEPVSAAAAADRIVYEFAVADDGPTAVTFEVEAVKPWLVRGQAGVEHGPEVGFSHFVYP